MAGLNEGLNESDVTSRLFVLIGKMSDEERQGLLDEIEKRPFLWKRRHDRKPYFSVVDYSTQEYPLADFIQDMRCFGPFPFPFPKSISPYRGKSSGSRRKE